MPIIGFIKINDNELIAHCKFILSNVIINPMAMESEPENIILVLSGNKNFRCTKVA